MLLSSFEGFDDGDENKCSRQEESHDERSVDAGCRGEDNKAKPCPRQGEQDALGCIERFPCHVSCAAYVRSCHNII